MHQLKTTAGWGACWIFLCLVPPAEAQFFGNVGGVCIDAQGLLRETRGLSPDDRLKLIQQEAAKPPGSEQIAAVSPARKVSLRRLEQAVQQLHQTDQPLPADVEHLAGLTAIKYVVFDPRRQDVILIGPAEGWTQLATGEVVGETSGRPVLHLEDLITGLRSVLGDDQTAAFIGCSIDPTPEGAARYAAYVNRLGRIDRRRVKPIFAGMEQAMGPQAVRTFGVEPSSRFALTLVAADYRLKRIALGHDPAPVPGVVNYLDLAAKRFRPGPQKQHRWWFQAHYDALYETADHLAFELEGQGVKVVTASSVPGQPSQAAQDKAGPAAEEFAASFTKRFPDIAAKHPIFAELSNLIALATVAELVAEKLRDVAASSSHWQPAHFLDGQACRLRAYQVPKQVPSLANYRLIQNRHWLISISGGVEIPARDLIRPENRHTAPRRSLTDRQETLRPPEEKQTWWWDE